MSGACELRVVCEVPSSSLPAETVLALSSPDLVLRVVPSLSGACELRVVCWVPSSPLSGACELRVVCGVPSSPLSSACELRVFCGVLSSPLSCACELRVVCGVPSFSLPEEIVLALSSTDLVLRVVPSLSGTCEL